jgi:AraC-type DNA-binding domain-containing proteins
MRPLLYSIVPEKTLKSMLETFHVCMQVPIQVIDEQGTLIAAGGVQPIFCKCFHNYLPQNVTCEIMHVSASKKAITLGESYIFECHANLNNIVFPLISNKTFLGSILVGPFLMDKPDSILISDITKRYNIPTEDALELYDEIDGIRIIEPFRVNHISHLVYHLFSTLIIDSKKELRENNQKLMQQSLINESIQRYKSEIIETSAYPYEKEKELLNKVKLGDIPAANSTLNDLLGYVFFSQGNSLEIVKSRAIELCSLLSRVAIEGGASADMTLKVNNQFIKNIQQINTIEDLCFNLQEIVESFSNSLLNHIPSHNSTIIKKAIVFIANHFNDAISLENVADAVNMHPSYFSSKFKKATGSSFKEYLNMVRIEEGKRLLTNTNFSIIDIALATGFEDQSYFTKVFKKYTGLTPKQFRE